MKPGDRISALSHGLPSMQATRFVGQVILKSAIPAVHVDGGDCGTIRFAIPPLAFHPSRRTGNTGIWRKSIFRRQPRQLTGAQSPRRSSHRYARLSTQSLWSQRSFTS